MSAPGYTIEALDFRAADAEWSHIGWANLLITPPGVLLSDARVIRTPPGLRIVFPGRPLLERETGAQRCDFLGRPLRLRQISFPDASAWNQFGVLAVLAIQHAFPAALDAALRITRALPRSARTAPDDRAATHTPRPSMPTSEAPKAAA